MDAADGTDPIHALEFAILGWPDDGPILRLDYRAFSYAGKFATGSTGTAVLRTADGRPVAPGWTSDRQLPDGLAPEAFADDVAAAVAFNADRTEPETLRLRYVSVHAALRGQGVAPRLVDGLLEPAATRGYERVLIAVNNPFAYEALYKAGFAFTGRETGIAELVLERPTRRPARSASDTATYRAGLDRYRERGPDGLSAAERAFLDAREGASPPE